MRALGLILTTIALGLSACATSEDRGPQGMFAPGDPARAVTASIETLVTTDPEVDADAVPFVYDAGRSRQVCQAGTAS